MVQGQTGSVIMFRNIDGDILQSGNIFNWDFPNISQIQRTLRSFMEEPHSNVFFFGSRVLWNTGGEYCFIAFNASRKYIQKSVHIVSVQLDEFSSKCVMINYVKKQALLTSQTPLFNSFQSLLPYKYNCSSDFHRFVLSISEFFINGCVYSFESGYLLSIMFVRFIRVWHVVLVFWFPCYNPLYGGFQFLTFMISHYLSAMLLTLCTADFYRSIIPCISKWKCKVDFLVVLTIFIAPCSFIYIPPFQHSFLRSLLKKKKPSSCISAFFLPLQLAGLRSKREFLEPHEKHGLQIFSRRFHGP